MTVFLLIKGIQGSSIVGMALRFSPQYLLTLAHSMIAICEIGPQIERFLKTLGYDISFGNQPIAQSLESMLEDIAIRSTCNGIQDKVIVRKRGQYNDAYLG